MPPKKAPRKAAVDVLGQALLPALPPEIWAKILDSVCNFPSLFRLCNVCSQWNGIIHKYFPNIGVVDVELYLKLDKSRNIADQIKYIVQERKHKVSGMIISDFKVNRNTVSNVFNQITWLKQALNMAIVSNLSGFEVFEFHARLVSYFTQIRDDIASIVHTVLEDAINLKHVTISLNRWSPFIMADVSRQMLIQSVNLKYCKVGNLVAGIKTLNCSQINGIECLQLINLLQTVAPLLESLTLVSIQINCSKPPRTYTLRFPNLKSISIGCRISGRPTAITIDLAVSHSLQSFTVNGNLFEITGTDDIGIFPDLEKFETQTCPQTLDPMAFATANLNCLNTLNVWVTSNELFSSITQRFVQGCPNLTNVHIYGPVTSTDHNIVSSGFSGA